MPDELLNLSRTDPTVAACVDLWRYGQLSYEEMLIMLCVKLCEEKSNLKEVAANAMQQQLPPVFVYPGPKEAFDGLREKFGDAFDPEFLDRL